MYGHSPTFSSGAPKRAWSEAMTRSQASASPNPPAMAQPCTRAMVGLPRFHSSSKSSASQPAGQVVVEVLVSAATRVPRRHAGQVGTGTEGLVALPGQDHHPHGGVGLGPGHLFTQATDDIPGHGVAPLGPVDGEGQDRSLPCDQQVAGRASGRFGEVGIGHRTTLSRVPGDCPVLQAGRGRRRRPTGRPTARRAPTSTVTPSPPLRSSPSASEAPTAWPSRRPSGSEALARLGFSTFTVAGDGPVDHLLPGLAIGADEPPSRYRARLGPGPRRPGGGGEPLLPPPQPRGGRRGGGRPGRAARRAPPPRPALAAPTVRPPPSASDRSPLATRDHQRAQPTPAGQPGAGRHHHLQRLRCRGPRTGPDRAGRGRRRRP